MGTAGGGEEQRAHAIDSSQLGPIVQLSSLFGEVPLILQHNRDGEKSNWGSLHITRCRRARRLQRGRHLLDFAVALGAAAVSVLVLTTFCAISRGTSLADGRGRRLAEQRGDDGPPLSPGEGTSSQVCQVFADPQGLPLPQGAATPPHPTWFATYSYLGDGQQLPLGSWDQDAAQSVSSAAYSPVQVPHEEQFIWELLSWPQYIPAETHAPDPAFPFAQQAPQQPVPQRPESDFHSALARVPGEAFSSSGQPPQQLLGQLDHVAEGAAAPARAAYLSPSQQPPQKPLLRQPELHGQDVVAQAPAAACSRSQQLPEQSIMQSLGFLGQGVAAQATATGCPPSQQSLQQPLLQKPGFRGQGAFVQTPEACLHPSQAPSQPPLVQQPGFDGQGSAAQTPAAGFPPCQQPLELPIVQALGCHGQRVAAQVPAALPAIQHQPQHPLPLLHSLGHPVHMQASSYDREDTGVDLVASLDAPGDSAANLGQTSIPSPRHGEVQSRAPPLYEATSVSSREVLLQGAQTQRGPGGKARYKRPRQTDDASSGSGHSTKRRAPAHVLGVSAPGSAASGTEPGAGEAFTPKRQSSTSGSESPVVESQESTRLQHSGRGSVTKWCEWIEAMTEEEATQHPYYRKPQRAQPISHSQYLVFDWSRLRASASLKPKLGAHILSLSMIMCRAHLTEATSVNAMIAARHLLVAMVNFADTLQPLKSTTQSRVVAGLLGQMFLALDVLMVFTDVFELWGHMCGWWRIFFSKTKFFIDSVLGLRNWHDRRVNAKLSGLILTLLGQFRLYEERTRPSAQVVVALKHALLCDSGSLYHFPPKMWEQFRDIDTQWRAQSPQRWEQLEQRGRASPSTTGPDYSVGMLETTTYTYTVGQDRNSDTIMGPSISISGSTSRAGGRADKIASDTLRGGIATSKGVSPPRDRSYSGVGGSEDLSPGEGPSTRTRTCGDAGIEEAPREQDPLAVLSFLVNTQWSSLSETHSIYYFEYPSVLPESVAGAPTSSFLDPGNASADPQRMSTAASGSGDTSFGMSGDSGAEGSWFRSVGHAHREIAEWILSHAALSEEEAKEHPFAAMPETADWCDRLLTLKFDWPSQGMKRQIRAKPSYLICGLVSSMNTSHIKEADACKCATKVQQLLVSMAFSISNANARGREFEGREFVWMLGLLFLVSDALYVFCNTFALWPRMRLWWDRFHQEIRRFLHNMPLSEVWHNRQLNLDTKYLVFALGEQLMLYKERKRPDPVVLVGLKKALLLSDSSLRYFKRPIWTTYKDLHEVWRTEYQQREQPQQPRAQTGASADVDLNVGSKSSGPDSSREPRSSRNRHRTRSGAYKLGISLPDSGSTSSSSTSTSCTTTSTRSSSSTIISTSSGCSNSSCSSSSGVDRKTRSQGASSSSTVSAEEPAAKGAIGIDDNLEPNEIESILSANLDDAFLQLLVQEGEGEESEITSDIDALLTGLLTQQPPAALTADSASEREAILATQDASLHDPVKTP